MFNEPPIMLGATEYAGVLVVQDWGLVPGQICPNPSNRVPEGTCPKCICTPRLSLVKFVAFLYTKRNVYDKT